MRISDWSSDVCSSDLDRMRSILPSVRGATRLNRRRLESSRTTVNSPLPRLFASSIRLFPRFLAPSRLGGKGYLADVGMRCSASVRVDLLIGADDQIGRAHV